MKKTFLLIIAAILCFSCEKEYMVPKREVPDWLQKRISDDEQIIKSHPHLMQNYGAWYRYKFERDYYYEYDNPLSSSYPNIYSHAGDRSYAVLSFTNYQRDKCCEKLIWKAPNYKRFKP